VIGGGWALMLFDVERGPTASELDTVVPDRPAIFYDQDGHSAWVNSQALAAAGITTCGPVPRGRIECGEAGRPSGTLRESAVDLIKVPDATTEQWLAGLKDAQSHLHSLGITMIQDANVNPRMLEIYHEAARSGLLTMKVVTAQLTNPAQLPIASQGRTRSARRECSARSWTVVRFTRRHRLGTERAHSFPAVRAPARAPGARRDKGPAPSRQDRFALALPPAPSIQAAAMVVRSATLGGLGKCPKRIGKNWSVANPRAPACRRGHRHASRRRAARADTAE
jgi:Amidohydrolase family